MALFIRSDTLTMYIYPSSITVKGNIHIKYKACVFEIYQANRKLQLV